MAKKKTHKKKTHRRHRVGALNMKPGSPIIKLAAIGAGYLLANPINGTINKLFGTPTDPVKTGKMVAVGQVGIGAALLFMKSGKPSLMKEIAGGVMIGAGLKRAMVVFQSGATTMGGYGDVPVIGSYKAPGSIGRRMNGYGDVPVIGAYTPNHALNGAKVMGGMTAGKTSDNGSTLMG